MLGKAIARLAIAAVSAFMAAAHADGIVTFGGTPAISYSGLEYQSGFYTQHVPGENRAIFAPVTPEQSEAAIHARQIPVNLNQGIVETSMRAARRPVRPALRDRSKRVSGATAALGPESISDMAEALRYDPDLIYEYVRNSIEYYPIWGLHKGPRGTMLDSQGTAFDQAALMVALLRVSGYSANFVIGTIKLSAAQVREWLGIETSNVCGVVQVLANGQIPIPAGGIVATTGGSCPWTSTSTPAPALVSIKLSHIWVKVAIDGVDYYFDPSYKPHTNRAGINLETVTGYNSAAYLAAAKAGSTFGPSYVQNINRSNIRNNLAAYANTLTNYLRANQPAGILDDVIGGMRIIPHSGTKLRQRTLPYEDATAGRAEWPAVPTEYMRWLRIRYAGIDRSYTSDEIYGKRFTLTYDSSNRPVLTLDGTELTKGTNAVVPGSRGAITFSVSHPYTRAVASEATQLIVAGHTYLIANAWGPASRGPIESHRRQLESVRALRFPDGFERVLGAALAMLSATWVADADHSGYVIDALGKTRTVSHHRVGIVGQTSAPYVDLPGNLTSVSSLAGDASREKAVFLTRAMHASMLESVAVQQVNGVSAVSTVKLIDIAAAAGEKIFDATSSSVYESSVKPSLVSCSGHFTELDGWLRTGSRIILPANCNIAENTWTGIGYLVVTRGGEGIGAIIGPGLAGGNATAPWSDFLVTSNSSANAVAPDILTQWSGASFGDPVDMASGSYLYVHSDLVSGAGPFPYGLELRRSYSSGAGLRSGPMGRGWTHNFATRVDVNSDGLQGMGEDSALDAVNTLVEQMVSLDLMGDATKPLEKMVIALIGQRWWGDQLLDNTAVVRQGLNGEVFVKLPDGTYNPPPGNSARLVRNADGTFAYETLTKDMISFNSAGQISKYVHPTGVEVRFGYSGPDLSTVSNSLGRTLSFTNTGGRITQVSDGSRTVRYAYDTDGKPGLPAGRLTGYTDAENRTTRFEYDWPYGGFLANVFYPTNPASAFVTNMYDNAGRVSLQFNANHQLFEYHFAGHRSEEVGPGGVSKVAYLDDAGRVVKSINSLGRATENTYDGQSRLVRTVLPEGNSVEYTYDDAPCAAHKRCTHNVKTVRRVPKPGSGLPAQTGSYTYEDAFNRVASFTDARSQTTTYTYTAQGSPLAVTLPADASGVQPATTFGYTAYTTAGFPTFNLLTSKSSKTSATGAVVTVTTYDPTNKFVPLTTVVDAGVGQLNLTTRYAYDGVGNLTQVDGPRIDVADVESTAYDAERRIVQTTDALGKITRYAYDPDGRLIRTSAQIGSQWLVSCREYTASGKLLRAWGPAQMASDACPVARDPVQVADYTYDELDRLSSVTENVGEGEVGGRITETYYFLDDSIREVRRAGGTEDVQSYATYTYTPNGLPATITDANGNLTSYQYDGFDRKLKVLLD